MKELKLSEKDKIGHGTDFRAIHYSKRSPVEHVDIEIDYDDHYNHNQSCTTIDKEQAIKLINFLNEAFELNKELR